MSTAFGRRRQAGPVTVAPHPMNRRQGVPALGCSMKPAAEYAGGRVCLFGEGCSAVLPICSREMPWQGHMGSNEMLLISRS